MAMPKLARELTALEVSRLVAPGKHPVGSGIYLEINPSGARVWILRTIVGNKRRHIGLGPYPATTLAQARQKARDARDLIAQGVDPVEHKREIKSALKAQQAKAVSFEQCAVSYIDAHADTWKNAKHRQQWQNTLRTYAFPVLGSLLVKDVAQAHVLSVLEPIWKTKTETATRVRGRIELILDWACARGYRSNDNPARWKGHLDKLLPQPSRLSRAIHHKALPIDQMPAFMAELNQHEGMSCWCLQFAILTASRSGEARGARWDEMDMKKAIWTIPAERMKAGQEHQVPLSSQAMLLLKNLPRTSSPYVFFSAKGTPLSDMALSMLMRRMGQDAVPHGFRSTFRDWAGDKTHYARDLAEAALAHTLTNKVEAAYRRSTALEKRRAMMQDWADFITGSNHSVILKFPQVANSPY